MLVFLFETNVFETKCYVLATHIIVFLYMQCNINKDI